MYNLTLHPPASEPRGKTMPMTRTAVLFLDPMNGVSQSLDRGHYHCDRKSDLQILFVSSRGDV